MREYANLSGRSGILAYDYGETYIKVLFADESVYLYSYASAGPEKVECMKTLAEYGYGLNTFINRCARREYALHTQPPQKMESGD